MELYLLKLTIYFSPTRRIKISFEAESEDEARVVACRLREEEIRKHQNGARTLQTESSLLKQIAFP